TYLDLMPVATAKDVLAMVEVAQTVGVSEPVKHYIIDIVEATRSHPDILLGASTRAALFLLRLSRVWAAAAGRDFVLPDDVKQLAVPVLAHRMALRPEAVIRGSEMSQVIAEILDHLEVPGTGSRSTASCGSPNAAGRRPGQARHWRSCGSSSASRSWAWRRCSCSPPSSPPSSGSAGAAPGWRSGARPPRRRSTTATTPR